MRAWPDWSPRPSFRHAGHEPIVLEGQQRIGGRVLTLREPFAPGLWGEAGAMRIPKTHHLTHALIDRYGLTTKPFTMDNPEAYCYFGGTRMRHRELADDPRVLGFETTDAERMAPTQLWANALDPFVRRLADDGNETRGPTSPRSTTSTAYASSSTSAAGPKVRSRCSGSSSTRKRS